MTQVNSEGRLSFESVAGASLPHTSLYSEVLQGLSGAQKSLPSKLFYDDAGSRLFDRICELDEYYVTRCELAILAANAAEMREAIGPGRAVLELGCGSGVKTRLLFGFLTQPRLYAPLDISQTDLLRAAARIRGEFPSLDVQPILGDFTRDIVMQASLATAHGKLVFFPGSTIGNFDVQERRKLLRRIAGLCRPFGGLLLGVDLRKDISVIERAYNDASGVTAAFNLNMLRHLNREFGGTFRVKQFFHHAYYNAELHRIEMHLVSRVAQSAVCAGHSFEFARGETIRTELSQKFDVAELAREASPLGLVLERAWTDSKQYFAVILFKVAD